MPLLFFDHRKQRAFEADFNTPPISAEYVHCLGKRFGTEIRLAGAEVPLHVVFTLDLADPRLGLEIPGVEELPVCYGFRFGPEDDPPDTACRILPDGRILLLRPERPQVLDGYPFPGYPDELPQLPMLLDEIAFRPAEDETVRLAGVFGAEHFSRAQQRRIVSTLRRLELIDEAESQGMTHAELIDAYAIPFAQGRPPGECPNPECPNYGREGAMKVFALLQDVFLDLILWGDWDYGQQMIFEICPKCFAVNVSNQGT